MARGIIVGKGAPAAAATKAKKGGVASAAKVTKTAAKKAPAKAIKSTKSKTDKKATPKQAKKQLNLPRLLQVILLAAMMVMMLDNST